MAAGSRGLDNERVDPAGDGGIGLAADVTVWIVTSCPPLRRDDRRVWDCRT